MTSTRQQRKDRMDWASLLISGASLAVGILALSLNEKGENMTEKQTPQMQYKVAKQQKKDASKERKAAKMTAKAAKTQKQNQIRQYAGGIGYDGPIILLNEKEYGLVPLENRKIVKEKATGPLPSRKPIAKEGSWVAMEINSRNGGDRQAIVCASRDEAKAKAMKMKKAHRPGSQQSQYCRQGDAKMDTSQSIDVGKWFAGEEGTLYRV